MCLHVAIHKMSVQTTLLTIQCPTCVSAIVFKSKYDYQLYTFAMMLRAKNYNWETCSVQLRLAQLVF